MLTKERNTQTGGKTTLRSGTVSGYCTTSPSVPKPWECNSCSVEVPFENTMKINKLKSVS